MHEADDPRGPLTANGLPEKRHVEQRHGRLSEGLAVRHPSDYADAAKYVFWLATKHTGHDRYYLAKIGFVLALTSGVIEDFLDRAEAHDSEIDALNRYRDALLTEHEDALAKARKAGIAIGLSIARREQARNQGPALSEPHK